MIDLQQVLVLASASALLVIAASCCFRDNPTTRRLFVVFASVGLLVAPVALTLPALRWQLPVLSEQHVNLRQFNAPIADWLAAATAGIALLLCCLVLVKAWRERRSLRRLPEICDPPLQLQIVNLQQKLGLSGSIRLFVGPAPCASGGWSAALVLPANWRNWSADTLTAVLTHELVHIRRRDDLLLVFQRLVSASLWWLPWVRRLQKVLEEAIEESCDDHAAALHADPVVYLQGLVNAASGLKSAGTSSLPALARSHILFRTQRFLGYRDFETDSRGLFWALVVVVGLLTASWTLELRFFQVDAAATGRVVAIALPAGPDHFEIELAREERGPPSPIRR